MGTSEFDPIAGDRRAWNSGRKVGAKRALSGTVASRLAPPLGCRRHFRGAAHARAASGWRGPDFWAPWLAFRAQPMPFWRNHREAIERGFHETGTSAVLILPTGAGKTTVSIIKIAGALARGKKVVLSSSPRSTRAVGQYAGGATGRMGPAVPCAGHAESRAHADARWIQPGLARLRGWRTC